MLIRIAIFLVSWFLGVVVLNKFVFQLMLEFVQNEGAVATICIITIIVWTVVVGIIAGVKK